jgi:hypothetical protein
MNNIAINLNNDIVTQVSTLPQYNFPTVLFFVDTTNSCIVRSMTANPIFYYIQCTVSRWLIVALSFWKSIKDNDRAVLARCSLAVS